MMFLTTWQFALAGILCAAGPLLIHLLNRRRVQVVPWAAMEFLRVAIRRQRRWMRLRDLLLLLLRMAAVLLFGAALSQPYWSEGERAFRGDQPVHAILLIDNSLSMGYQQTDGTRLQEAQRQARKLIQRLPAGSRISVIPACGIESPWAADPFDDPERALESLERITVVDRQLVASQVFTSLQQAQKRVPDLATRCIWFGDQQRHDWSDRFKEPLPPELDSLQLVDVSEAEYENSWIVDVRLQDGVADVETPATILVDVAHQGPTTREQVPVTLWIDDQAVATQLVTLAGDGTRRSLVFQHQFGAQKAESGKPSFIPIRASLPGDRLPADDQRWTLAPVLTSVPVVFVDQFGPEEENVALQRLGETRHLRRLLAPPSSEPTTRPLVRIRHVRIDQLDRAVLADARLVVIAGCPTPEPAVELLREYVEQGGPLFVAAGAQFDPAAWQAAAWLDGDGLLPVPLRATPLGATPEEARGNLQTFSIDFASLEDTPLFRLAGVGLEALQDFYAEPFFFKAITVEPDADWKPAWLERQQQKLLRDLDARWPIAADAKRAAAAQDGTSQRGQAATDPKSMPQTDPQTATPDPVDAVKEPDASEPTSADRRAADTIRWLLWENPATDASRVSLEQAEISAEVAADSKSRQQLVTQQLERLQPRVLARLSDPAKSPLLIERELGEGRVLFFTSGVLSSWNTLPQTNAVLLLDRILRSLLEATLPRYDFPTGEQVLVPLPRVDRGTEVGLQRPGQTTWSESYRVNFVRRNQLGIILPYALQRGLYQLLGELETEPGQAGSAAADGGQPAWTLALAVQGDAAESDWEPLTPDEITALSADTRLSWVAPGAEISLVGNRIRARDAWWWLVLAVLVLLSCELLLLARSGWQAAAAEHR